ncbi:AraC family transcriptional regulator [bacterium]|nr:MAG: AraC family transcriptional regulator [bacterium]
MRRKRESERLITQIQRILHEKICDPRLNVSYLARTLCVSTQHIYQLVYSYYWDNPKKVIESCRLARVLELIGQNSEINLSLVASQSGFVNYNTFLRCFKRRLQISPSKYIALPTHYRPSIKYKLSRTQAISIGPAKPDSRVLMDYLQDTKRPQSLINKRLQETG